MSILKFTLKDRELLILEKQKLLVWEKDKGRWIIVFAEKFIPGKETLCIGEELHPVISVTAV